MVTSNALEALKKENELLDELAKTASAFTKNAGGIEAIANNWVQYFRECRKCNELISKDKSVLERELKEGLKVLKSQRKSVEGLDSNIAQFYRNVLDKEIKVEEKLL
jgi:hypothetical protein